MKQLSQCRDTGWMEANKQRAKVQTDVQFQAHGDLEIRDHAKEGRRMTCKDNAISMPDRVEHYCLGACGATDSRSALNHLLWNVDDREQTALSKHCLKYRLRILGQNLTNLLS